MCSNATGQRSPMLQDSSQKFKTRSVRYSSYYLYSAASAALVVAVRSHRSIVPSRLALARIVPSALNETSGIDPVCPMKVVFSCPVSMSHRRIALVALPRENTLPPASVFPSGLMARQEIVSHTNVFLCSPVCASHRRIVSSQLPLMRVFSVWTEQDS